MKRISFRWYSGILPLAAGLALFVILAVWTLSGIREAARLSDAEEQRQAERAVREAAVSYYVLEGAYPADYEQLKAYSGLAVNEEKYVVFYEVFASNIMPDITVMERQGR